MSLAADKARMQAKERELREQREEEERRLREAEESELKQGSLILSFSHLNFCK